MDREQLARECLKVEQAGGNVREYLGNCGCISPWGTWYRLQKEELGRHPWQIRDGKGGTDMAKITLEIKKKAVDIALNGGHPTTYLKEQGVKNPSSTWYVIKKNLEKVDPGTYARVIAMKDQEEEPAAADEIMISTEPSEAGITKPLNYDGFEVTALKSPGTGFRFTSDPRYGMMTWNTVSGDEVSLTAEEWHNLAAELPKVLQIFGI